MRSQIAKISEPTLGPQIIRPPIKEPPKMGGSFGKEEGVISESISQADLYGVAISGVYLL